ncbi:unnamed protein product [Brachionus calyciflorus]|uniref:Glycosyltransferase 2-like domain-containing protein n=1 Tax=Brachionus calyciflorus TaxID=104777 RepID=A0A814BEJ6_9BILA|nr:unnamed protein product [Brachionus calyciflorus]
MAVTVISKKLEFDEEKSRQKFLEKTQLRCSGRFRWNILIIIIILVFYALPFFIPLIGVFVINAYFILLWALFAIINIIRHFKIHFMTKKFRTKFSNIDTISENVDGKYQYLMVTFAYKEPEEIILKCLRNIKSLNGSKNVIMAVCLEEGTPNLKEKIASLNKEFESQFKELIITIHPYGVEGEIPGKCSNSNYGIRSIYNHLKENNASFKPENYILVNFDIDSIFHNNFLDVLKETVNKEKQPEQVVWQPLLYYNWNLDKLTFFTRIIGILRSKMMGAALVTFNINVMSVFCSSLKLYVDGNFVHPFYQMDDIICFIRWNIVSKKSLKIKPIYSPTISGPTSGATWFEELKELIIQGKRWTIGSAEVFHYFMCKVNRMNGLDALLWGFNYLNYYCGFLCVHSLVSISTTLRLLIFEDDKENIWSILFLSFPVFLYILNGLMIIVNKMAVKSFLGDLQVVENIGIFREFIHWILTIPTEIFYSFITLCGFLSILIHGKKVCKHRASNKDNLV